MHAPSLFVYKLTTRRHVPCCNTAAWSVLFFVLCFCFRNRAQHPGSCCAFAARVSCLSVQSECTTFRLRAMTRKGMPQGASCGLSGAAELRITMSIIDPSCTHMACTNENMLIAALTPCARMRPPQKKKSIASNNHVCIHTIAALRAKRVKTNGLCGVPICKHACGALPIVDKFCCLSILV